MRLPLALAAMMTLTASPALAQEDAIDQRQDLMMKNGSASRVLSRMVRGQQPFDAEQAAEAARTIAEDMEAFVTLFPEGSEGGDAADAIWTQRAAFDQAAERLVVSAKAAADAAANGPDALRSAFQAVGQACSSCHQTFRLED